MLREVRSRLTYANVVASMALFVALGGVGYAAVKLPKNSVGNVPDQAERRDRDQGQEQLADRRRHQEPVVERRRLQRIGAGTSGTEG